MKKRNILKKNIDFVNLINKGYNCHNKYFNLYINDNKYNYSRFGISVGKKIGNAVTRNYYKRIIKSICDNNIDYDNNKDYLIIMRKECLNLSYQEYERELVSLFNKMVEEYEKKNK